jgi:TonB family protein
MSDLLSHQFNESGGGDSFSGEPSHSTPPSPPGSPVPHAPANESMRRSFRNSAILHAAAFTLIILKSLVFPGEPKPYVPSLRVDMVALPDTLKKDLANTPPSQSAKDIADALKSAEKSAEDQAKSIKPIKLPEPQKAEKKAPKEEVAEPDELVLHPKKAVKKAEKPSEKPTPPKEKADPSRDLKLKSALARIKAMNRIHDSETPAAPSAVVKGNQISKGTSLSGDAKENSESGYYDLVHSRLLDNWSLPVWLSRQNYSAQVQIFIDSRGRVRNFKFLKASGNEQFDSAVKKAIEESQPFPAPPEDLAASLLVHGVKLGFPL